MHIAESVLSRIRTFLVMTGIAGGSRIVEVPGDQIVLSFVLGNKVAVGSVNANRTYFERGVQDMALTQTQYPGWLKRLLSDPVGFRELFF